MRLSLCTISFRHHLLSLDQVAHAAKSCGLDGIELWGVHARNLRERSEYDRAWLEAQGLYVPMVSDYLPLDGDAKAGVEKAVALSELARWWGAIKLRTFAGGRGSADVCGVERALWTARLRELCVVADAHGIALVVETHPGTLADTVESTLRLVEEVDHPALRLNFDVIHVWESGADPLDALRRLAPRVSHMHFKNVASRDRLTVFAPPNVYAPAGDRDGMVGLFDGALDYRRFLRFVAKDSGTPWDELEASLEWFGHDVLATLREDARGVRVLAPRVESRLDATSKSTSSLL